MGHPSLPAGGAVILYYCCSVGRIPDFVRYAPRLYPAPLPPVRPWPYLCPGPTPAAAACAAKSQPNTAQLKAPPSPAHARPGRPLLVHGESVRNTRSKRDGVFLALRNTWRGESESKRAGGRLPAPLLLRTRRFFSPLSRYCYVSLSSFVGGLWTWLFRSELEQKTPAVLFCFSTPPRPPTTADTKAHPLPLPPARHTLFFLALHLPIVVIVHSHLCMRQCDF